MYVCMYVYMYGVCMCSVPCVNDECMYDACMNVYDACMCSVCTMSQ